MAGMRTNQLSFSGTGDADTGANAASGNAASFSMNMIENPPGFW
jgi:hypothetical protein